LLPSPLHPEISRLHDSFRSDLPSAWTWRPRFARHVRLSLRWREMDRPSHSGCPHMHRQLPHLLSARLRRSNAPAYFSNSRDRTFPIIVHCQGLCSCPCPVRWQSTRLHSTTAAATRRLPSDLYCDRLLSGRRRQSSLLSATASDNVSMEKHNSSTTFPSRDLDSGAHLKQELIGTQVQNHIPPQKPAKRQYPAGANVHGRGHTSPHRTCGMVSAPPLGCTGTCRIHRGARWSPFADTLAAIHAKANERIMCSICTFI
jgi:hypothetical protein